MLADRVIVVLGWMSGQRAAQSKVTAGSFTGGQDVCETGNIDAVQVVDSQLSPAQENTSVVGVFDLAQYRALLSSVAALVAEADDVVTPTGGCSAADSVANMPLHAQ